MKSLLISILLGFFLVVATVGSADAKSKKISRKEPVTQEIKLPTPEEETAALNDAIVTLRHEMEGLEKEITHAKKEIEKVSVASGLWRVYSRTIKNGTAELALKQEQLEKMVHSLKAMSPEDPLQVVSWRIVQEE